MSIKQLEDITRELREEAKKNNALDSEYQKAYSVLEEKIRERDKRRPKCIPWRHEHSLDLMEEF